MRPSTHDRPAIEEVPGGNTTGYFWHLTDLHLDRDYSTRGSRKLSCHRIDKGPTGLRTVGPYGDFLCNTPKLLAASTFAAMERIKPDVDFILWTGDNMPHANGITWSALYSQTDWIRAVLSRHAMRHRALLVPTLGNHDWVPANALDSEDAVHYRAFLNEAGFRQLLPVDGWSTFERGGYYSRSLSKNIRLVCINSAIWYSINKGQRPGPNDPQMAWLREQLHDAQRLGQKARTAVLHEPMMVFISGHIGPGFFVRSIADKAASTVLFDDINDKYQDLIAEYKDVVAGQFFGHQHSNTFVLLSDRNGTPVSSVQLAGSVTPWGSSHPIYRTESVPTNPCVRLYTYRRNTGELLDYTVYYLDLEKANVDALRREEPQWELLYSARSYLGVPDLSTASMIDLANRIARSPDLLSRYIALSSSLKDSGPCGKVCRRTMLCAALASRLDFHAACLAQRDSSLRVRLRKTNRAEAAIPTCLDVAILLLVTVTGLAFIAIVKRNSMIRLYPRYARFW
ncbi:acid sphingomyelinase-like phosphodiesterase 3b [Rhipicephalus sanguineus]|uniref:acid sphingomyelinase-like phosphodiesterase 3b n=1 Tax=Rhipicephalus sanguineus TaxID=34632 RepID=UPI0020C3C198|nr:acid sphingomyelinase-like phosphodiesterase 3b [Rhipicephalus sanguineus]